MEPCKGCETGGLDDHSVECQADSYLTFTGAQKEMSDRIKAAFVAGCDWNKHTSPAIPEEAEGFLQNCISHMVGVAFGLDEPKKNEILEKVKSARAWLAQCQTATDKAVCPRCGNDNNVAVYPITAECVCEKCDHSWTLGTTLVISPPRETKGTP